jgi:hypothetical protein
MDVTNKLQKVLIFFAYDGFVSVLEKVTTPFMTLVESERIACHKAAHDFAEWRKTCAQQEMEVVWNERPGVALGLGFIEDQSKTFQK